MCVVLNPSSFWFTPFKDESYTQKDHEQHRVTVPQPFKLHDRKRKRQTEELPDGQVAPGGKFRSMAEEINMFSTKTPERFRSKAKKGEKRVKFP